MSGFLSIFVDCLTFRGQVSPMPMIAKDAISTSPAGFVNDFGEIPASSLPTSLKVDAGEPLCDVIPRLLASPSHRLTVTDGTEYVGSIDMPSMLEAVGRMFPPREDCSQITLECDPADYSASLIARAVEDVDAHLLDLWTDSSPEGRTSVTLRVRLDNPEAAVRSLRRYGYDVTDAVGPTSPSPIVEEDRLSALRLFLNV